MATRTQKIKLGIFMVVSAALFVVALAGLGALHLFSPENMYVIRFQDSVSGLELGAPVKLRGVNVGRVSAIRLPSGNIELVEVEIEVDEDIPVKMDASALLKFQGITGLKYIEIERGTNQAALRPSGSEIPAGKSALDKITDQAEDLAERVDRLLTKLTAVDWAETLVRIDRVVAISERIVLRLESDLQAVGAESRGLVSDARVSMKKVDGVLVALESAGKDAQMTMANASKVVSEARELVENGSGDVRLSLANLRQATASFKELAQALRLQPSTLFFDNPPPERKRR
jgi:phospholipid/cholesterol/gamma-HCH transport system substrate-binding protein